LTSEDIATAAHLHVRGRAPQRARTALLRVLKILVLSTFTLLYAETFVRLLSPQSVVPRYVVGAPWGVRGNMPNARYWHHTPEVDVEYRINSEGLRADRDYPFLKPKGTCRIAVFGDSFTMGYELDIHDTFTTRLEQLLRERGWRADVLNFSVSGFGTAEMLRTYEAYARKFDPDVVMFSWHYSDVDDNVRSGLYRLHAGTLENANPTYLPGGKAQNYLLRSRLYRFVADNSQLYTLLRDRAVVFTKQMLVNLRQESHAPNIAAEADDAGGRDEDEEVRAAQKQANLDLSSAVVARAAQVVTMDGRDFYLIEIPTRISRIKFRSSVDVLSASVRANINIISPLAAFENAAQPDLKLYYELGHGHFTPAAAQLLAQEAVETLARSAHLSACASPLR
jgi:hypothetical protein